jgi:subtilisin family serine protease
MKSLGKALLGITVLVLTLVACSGEVADTGGTLETAAVSPRANYIVVAKGNLKKDLAKVAAARGDSVTFMSTGAGLASVVTSDPNAYARFGTVTRDVNVQWLQPTHNVAFEGASAGAETGSPPFSELADGLFNYQWGHTAVRAVQAWDAEVTGKGVTVAVVDSGFDLTHPDLEPNIDLDRSANFVPGETLQYAIADPFSHGSHTAGTIAAAMNGIGTIGVAPDAKLMLVKVLSDEGSGSFTSVMQGIIHAADNGADIINMSLGALLYKAGFWDDNGTPDPTDDVWVSARDVAELKNAIGAAVRYAGQRGVLVVASAGNDAIDFDHAGALITVPGSLPGVVTVGAIGPYGWLPQIIEGEEPRFDRLASYSNFGRSHLDFGAPGGDYVYLDDYPTQGCDFGAIRPCGVFDFVFSTGSQNGYYWSVGTSMAAPHVAGVAALVLSEYGGHGSLKPAQLLAQLRKRAWDAGQPGNDPAFGMGIVQTGH